MWQIMYLVEEQRYIWWRFAKEWVYRAIVAGSAGIERQIENSGYLFEKLSCVAYLFS